MNSKFFRAVLSAISKTRLDAYRRDGVDDATTLGRYLWNTALCEALYSPLQMAEVTLKNGVNKALTNHFGTPGWFDKASLTAWGNEQVDQAKQVILKDGKSATADRIVATLHFGFWTAFFDNRYAKTNLGPCILKTAFSNCLKSNRILPLQRGRWKEIRSLRNHVFHHERILHWTDLREQHKRLLEAIGWISPEMEEIAWKLDRFERVYSDGIEPWKEFIQNHWPKKDL